MNQPNAPLPYWGPPRPASLPGSVVLLPAGLAAAASGPAADGGWLAEGRRPALEPGGTAGMAAWRGAGGSLSLFLRPGAQVLSAWRCMRRGLPGCGPVIRRRCVALKAASWRKHRQILSDRGRTVHGRIWVLRPRLRYSVVDCTWAACASGRMCGSLGRAGAMAQDGLCRELRLYLVPGAKRWNATLPLQLLRNPCAGREPRLTDSLKWTVSRPSAQSCLIDKEMLRTRALASRACLCPRALRANSRAHGACSRAVSVPRTRGRATNARW